MAVNGVILDPVAYGLITLILILLIGIIYIIYRAVKNKKEGPSHLDLYFDSNFRNIIDEWDLIPRSRLKDWKNDMNRRMDALSKDISYIEAQRKKLNPRLTKIENQIAKLEKL